MDNVKDSKNPGEKTFTATIAKIIDEYTVIINRGALDDIKQGQRFLLYRLSEEEMKDPISGKSLGYLEMVKGTGKVIHVQERMSTIESDKTKPSERRIVRRKSPFTPFMGAEEETIVLPGNLVPFDEPEIGDRAKPI